MRSGKACVDGWERRKGRSGWGMALPPTLESPKGPLGLLRRSEDSGPH